MKEIMDLLTLGYKFNVEKDNIRVSYEGFGNDPPPIEDIEPHFESIKSDKEKALTYLNLTKLNKRLFKTSSNMQILWEKIERFSKERDEHNTMYCLAEMLDMLFGSTVMQMEIMGNFDLPF